MDTLTPVSVADVSGAEPEVDALLARHHALMRATSPAESCHVLTASELQSAGARIVMARDGTGVLGIGALVHLTPSHGEIKSMHTAEAARGRGVARLVLRALMARAQEAGLTRLSLETGTAPPFAAARALYAAEGFADCPPFGDYTLDPLSVFMSREI